MERQLQRERELAAQERESLQRKARDLQEKLSAILRHGGGDASVDMSEETVNTTAEAEEPDAKTSTEHRRWANGKGVPALELTARKVQAEGTPADRTRGWSAQPFQPADALCMAVPSAQEDDMDGKRNSACGEDQDWAQEDGYLPTGDSSSRNFSSISSSAFDRRPPLPNLHQAPPDTGAASFASPPSSTTNLVPADWEQNRLDIPDAANTPRQAELDKNPSPPVARHGNGCDSTPPESTPQPREHLPQEPARKPVQLLPFGDARCKERPVEGTNNCPVSLSVSAAPGLIPATPQEPAPAHPRPHVRQQPSPQRATGSNPKKTPVESTAPGKKDTPNVSVLSAILKLWFDPMVRRHSSQDANIAAEDLSALDVGFETQAPANHPTSQTDKGMMLIAAAVTMAPSEERADFLLSLTEKERKGALEWMDPSDLAETISAGWEGGGSSAVLKDMRMDVLKPVFLCMEPTDRGRLLKHCDPTVAQALLVLLDVGEGMMLLGDLRDHSLGPQVLEVMPRQWVQRAVAETDAALIHEAIGLSDWSVASRDAMLQALPTEKLLELESFKNACGIQPLEVSGLASPAEGMGNCSLLLPQDENTPEAEKYNHRDRRTVLDLSSE